MAAIHLCGEFKAPQRGRQHTTVCVASMAAVYLCREPEALQLLIKLYVERSHSVWKEPEVGGQMCVCDNKVTLGTGGHLISYHMQVLTWLEANARKVIARVDNRDPLIEDCARK